MLLYHPHVHMIVPGGGLTPDGTRWVGAAPDYLLPVQVLSRALRGRLLTGIKTLHAAGALRFYGLLANRNRAQNLVRCRELLGAAPARAAETNAQETWQEVAVRLLGRDPLCCPECGQGRLEQAAEIPPHARPPPPTRAPS